MSGITGHHGKSGIVGGDGVTTSSTWYTTSSQTLSSSTETVENFAISNALNLSPPRIGKGYLVDINNILFIKYFCASC